MMKRMFKRVVKHLENRRKFNRMKRWMRERAYPGRLVVGLCNSGALRLYR